MSEAANPELAAIDAYLDVAPRAVCRAESVGPFTLFVGTGPWRYYGRPTPGHGRELTVTDVLACSSASASSPSRRPWSGSTRSSPSSGASHDARASTSRSGP
jgi:hypothetical protein